jgi:serine/threonine-protein kinase
VHRDIKPENLFLTRRTQGMGVIKVLDFGISKVALNVPASSSKQRVRTVVAMGSPVYMSPEQVRACGEVDARSDIWSLGCVLFELLTGEQPFDAPTLMQLGAAIVEHQPKRPSDLVPELPAQLEAVVLRCLEKDVTKRFQNIAELAVALYPFAPRRARIFAERCSLLLTGTPCAVSELDIKSIAPPAASTSGSSSAPVTVDGAAASRGRSARKRLVPVALVAAAAVTGGLIWSQIRSVPAPAAGVTIATPAAPAAAPSPAALAAPVTPSPEIEEPASPAPEASASAVKRAAAPTSKIRARKPAAPARSSSPRAPSLARDEEPDVGF